jgi:outer membrane immunogenic protein
MIYSKLLGAGTLLAVVALPHVAQAADPYVPEPATDLWSGAYAGLYAGYITLEADGDYGGEGIGDDGPVDGGLYGGQIGFNHQIDSAVLGLEADIAYSDASGVVLSGSGERAETDLQWLATLRARGGFAFGESQSTLIFATAGLAIGEFDVDFEGAQGDVTQYGLVVGGGIEHRLTEDFSLKVEYNYVSFEDKDNDDAEATDVGYDGHIVKAGANFHF